MRAFSHAALALLCLTGCVNQTSSHVNSLNQLQQDAVAHPAAEAALASARPIAPVLPVRGVHFGPATPYHAYGDSITAGYALADSSKNYASLLADAEYLDLADRAIPGDQACDVPTRQIFPHADSPALNNDTLYSLLISTNDVDIRGIGPYESVFNLCHQATLAWLALPVEYKILPTDPRFVASGPTQVDDYNNWNALITQGAGAAVNVTFRRKVTGPVYVWYRIGDNNAGAFSYALDGNVLGHLTTATNPTLHTYNGSYDSFALLRIPDVLPGTHSLTITQTSLGTYDVGIVAIGVPPNVPHKGLPRLLVGTTPMQYNGWNVPCNFPSSPNCAAYIADITSNVNLLAGDGLDIQLFDSRKYMSGTAQDMADGLHPNPTGHREILHSITDIF